MQQNIVLVKYINKEVHSFKIDKDKNKVRKKLTTLCDSRFGLSEKVTWGDISEVTCSTCKEIQYEEFRKQEELERKRLEQEQLERKRLEQEELERKRLEQEELERERLEQEELERKRLEREKYAAALEEELEKVNILVY